MWGPPCPSLCLSSGPSSPPNLSVLRCAVRAGGVSADERRLRARRCAERRPRGVTRLPSSSSSSSGGADRARQRRVRCWIVAAYPRFLHEGASAGVCLTPACLLCHSVSGLPAASPRSTEGVSGCSLQPCCAFIATPPFFFIYYSLFLGGFYILTDATLVFDLNVSVLCTFGTVVMLKTQTAGFQHCTFC